MNFGQPEARLVARDGLGCVSGGQVCPQEGLGFGQIAAKEREKPKIELELVGPPLHPNLAGELLGITERPGGGWPVRLAHGDRSQHPVKIEHVGRLAGGAVEFQDLEHLAPRLFRLSGGQREEGQVPAGDGGARRIALGLVHGDGALQMFAGTRQVIDVHRDVGKPVVGSGDGEEVVRPLGLCEPHAQSFHRLSKVAVGQMSSRAVGDGDREPADVVRSAESLLCLPEESERRRVL